MGDTKCFYYHIEQRDRELVSGLLALSNLNGGDLKVNEKGDLMCGYHRVGTAYGISYNRIRQFWGEVMMSDMPDDEDVFGAFDQEAKGFYKDLAKGIPDYWGDIYKVFNAIKDAKPAKMNFTYSKEMQDYMSKDGNNID